MKVTLGSQVIPRYKGGNYSEHVYQGLEILDRRCLRILSTTTPSNWKPSKNLFHYYHGHFLRHLLVWSPCFLGPLTSFLIISLILQKHVSNSFLKRIAWEPKFYFVDTGNGIFSLKLLFFRIFTVCYYTAFLLLLLLVVTPMSSNT